LQRSASWHQWQYRVDGQGVRPAPGSSKRKPDARIAAYSRGGRGRTERPGVVEQERGRPMPSMKETAADDGVEGVHGGPIIRGLHKNPVSKTTCRRADHGFTFNSPAPQKGQTVGSVSSSATPSSSNLGPLFIWCQADVKDEYEQSPHAKRTVSPGFHLFGLSVQRRGSLAIDRQIVTHGVRMVKDGFYSKAHPVSGNHSGGGIVNRLDPSRRPGCGHCRREDRTAMKGPPPPMERPEQTAKVLSTGGLQVKGEGHVDEGGGWIARNGAGRNHGGSSGLPIPLLCACDYSTRGPVSFLHEPRLISWCRR